MDSVFWPQDPFGWVVMLAGWLWIAVTVVRIARLYWGLFVVTLEQAEQDKDLSRRYDGLLRQAEAKAADSHESELAAWDQEFTRAKLRERP